jgi:hypothetical protein
MKNFQLFPTRMEAIAFATRNYFPNTFEGEDGGDNGSGGEDDSSGGGGGGGQGGRPVFTQEQVNSIIAKERRAVEEASRKANADALNQLEMLQTKANLSDEEKSELEGQITELKKKVFTAEELSAQEKKKLQSEYDQKMEELSGQRDYWQGQFTEATISRSITDEAVRAEAFNPSQINAILRPQTRLVEVKDEEGNVQGFAPTVTMKTKDKEGKPIELELTVDKAIATMKEDPNFFNLFKGKSLDGLGSGNGGSGGGSVDPASMSMEQYKAFRDKEKKAGRR